LRLGIHLLAAKFYHHFKRVAAGALTTQQQRMIPAGGHRLDELRRGEFEDFHNSADVFSECVSGSGQVQLARRNRQPGQNLVDQPSQPVECCVFYDGFVDAIIHLNTGQFNPVAELLLVVLPGFVKGIDLVIAFALGRPDIFAVKLVSEGLIMIDPPEVH
jgi:hypothetical protein